MSFRYRSWLDSLMIVTCCRVSRNTHVPPLPPTVFDFTTTSPTPGLTMSLTPTPFPSLTAVTSTAVIPPLLATNRYGDRPDRLRTSECNDVESDWLAGGRLPPGEP